MTKAWAAGVRTKTIGGREFRFVTREEAFKRVLPDKPHRSLQARNYELERDLDGLFGGNWVVTDWCPYDGRFSVLSHFVPYPHPPMVREELKPPETGRPWNEFDFAQIPPETEPGMAKYLANLKSDEDYRKEHPDG